MDEIYLPARYDELTELDLQAHFRHCAHNIGDRDRVEFLLCETGVVIPVIKRIYVRKPAALTFLARSGSIDRNTLARLRDQFESEGYDLNTAATRKRKLLSRVSVTVTVDDPLFPIKASAILRAITLQLGSFWPQPVSVGYALGSEGYGMPGRLTIGNPVLNASRRIGWAFGRLLGQITS